jgi:hypothetical protein
MFVCECVLMNVGPVVVVVVAVAVEDPRSVYDGGAMVICGGTYGSWRGSSLALGGGGGAFEGEEVLRVGGGGTGKAPGCGGGGLEVVLVGA